MKRLACALLLGAIVPIAALAADAPGPDWAFMTPSPRMLPHRRQPVAAGSAPAAAPAAPAGVPQIVVAGKAAEVRPCNTCHTLSGMGQPESANIRGLNAVYFQRQMADFKSRCSRRPALGRNGGLYARI